MGCVHLTNSFIIWGGIKGNSSVKICVFMGRPWAMLSLINVYACDMVEVWILVVVVLCIVLGMACGVWLVSLWRIMRHFGFRFPVICWLQMLGIGL